MSATAAGSIFMWMAGVLIGLGAAGEGDRLLMGAGSALSLMAFFYVRRFAENERH